MGIYGLRAHIAERKTATLRGRYTMAEYKALFVALGSYLGVDPKKAR